jgi:Protein of unknown function (DUF3108)
MSENCTAKPRILCSGFGDPADQERRAISRRFTWAGQCILTSMLGSQRSSARSKALLLLAIASHSALAGAGEPDRIFLRYEVFGGPGLHFMTLTTTVDQSSASYSIAAQAETRGLADLFLDLRSRLEVRGRIAAGALLPQAMQAETHRRGADLNTRIDYGADGAVMAEASPPPAQSIVPTSPAQMRGTIDQLTAYLVLARHLGRRGSCMLTLAVFDGRRRYDLNFTDAAPETLPGIAGAVQVCWMSRRRIAGFPAESGGNETADQGKLWFARLLPGDLMVPVRMEFASEFGSFTAELAEMRGRGADLRLSE